MNGLANASSLFFLSAGLSLIFGVTRIVNMAHGSLYMLGAYIAYTCASKLGGMLGFWGGLVATAAAQPAPGARALVGDWIGTWKSASGSSGYLSITIDALDGDQVRGSLFMAVVAPDAWGYYNRSVAFRGFFDGAALRITVPPALWFELTVSGRALRGIVQGQQTFGAVELERK